MRLIPAGVSKKTGKPYKAFYSCKCGATAPAGHSAPVANSYTPEACNCNDTFDKMREAFIKMQKRLDSHDALLVDLRGKDAVDLHESWETKAKFAMEHQGDNQGDSLNIENPLG